MSARHDEIKALFERMNEVLYRRDADVVIPAIEHLLVAVISFGSDDRAHAERIINAVVDRLMVKLDFHFQAYHRQKTREPIVRRDDH